MNRTNLLLLVSAILMASFFNPGLSIAAERADFFVATDGSDQWSGSLAGPNSDKSDGPFATLQRAREAVRDLKTTKKDDIVVLIRGGTYRLKQTIVFGLQDSAGDKASITYAAWPGETPVFTSGHEIEDWVRVSEELPGLPVQARGKVLVANVTGQFRTLFDSDGLLPRARSAGFIPLKAVVATVYIFPPES